MGIRIALGATRSRIVGMVMGEASVLVVAGLAAGTVLSLALASLIRSQLFGVNPRDPWTLVGASLSLALAAGWAALIPALRASWVDPTSALRRE